MINVEVTETAKNKAKQLHIEKKLEKQVKFLSVDPHYPSLRFKPYVALKGKEVWKFEIDLNWWGLTVKTPENTIRVYNIIHHP